VTVESGAPPSAAIDAPARTILGFRIYAFPSADALISAVDGRSGLLVALNAEKLANGNPDIREIVNRSIGYADGYGAVLAMRRRGARTARIAGADLWLHLIRRVAGIRRVYLVGSTDEVMAATVRRLRTEFPNLDIAGSRNGFLSEDDRSQLAADLRATKADIVLVAMGSPRQELVMDELQRSWPALYIGLGGSLDVYVGVRRRAPRWAQRLGLEWIHRFVVDPKRLTRLPAYVRFAWLLARGRT
jgi:UDP-N-acetyl-D-mannosaminouronate:lipid I N-acetyl-D-mannosaminouronosyltransferase